MGNGTKVALVALLILMVVVIARFVRNESKPAGGQGGDAAKVELASKAGARKGSDALRQGPTIRPRSQDPASVRQTFKDLAVSSGQGAQAPPPSFVGPVLPPSSAGQVTPVKTTLPQGDPGPRGAAQSEPQLSAASEPVAAAPVAGSGAHENPEPPMTEGARARAQEAQHSGALSTTGAEGGSPLTPLRVPQGVGGPRVMGEPRDRGPSPADQGPAGQVTVAGGGTPPTAPVGEGRAAENRTAVPGAAGVQVTEASTAQGFPKTYKVLSGDSYWKIAARFYGKSTQKLADHVSSANPGVKVLQPGQEISIPAPPAAPASRAAVEGAAKPGVARTAAKAPSSAEAQTEPEPRPPEGKAGTETRQQGAKPSGSKDSKAVAKGTPKPASGSTNDVQIASAGGYRMYTVEKGDTPMKLAKKFYGDANKFWIIQDANQELKYGGELIAGAKIRIPPAP